LTRVSILSAKSILPKHDECPDQVRSGPGMTLSNTLDGLALLIAMTASPTVVPLAHDDAMLFENCEKGSHGNRLKLAGVL
jgi:hypothetical protein